MTIDAVLLLVVLIAAMAFGVWLGVRTERARHQIGTAITDFDRGVAVDDAADMAQTDDWEEQR